jgi:post-segregation antitoxin (ccd killing protein)
MYLLFMVKKITTVKIDSEILKEARHEAIDRGITFSELLEVALKKEFKKQK